MRYLGALLVLFAVTACSSMETPEPVTIVRTEKPKPIIHPSLPDPIRIDPPTVFVIDSETARRLDEEVELGRRGPWVFFALTEDDYLNVAGTYEEFVSWAREVKRVITFYREQR